MDGRDIRRGCRAVLILSRGHWVNVGILGAILFLVGIGPLGLDVMPNLLLLRPWSIS